MATTPASRASRFLHGSYLLGLGVQATIGMSQLLIAILLTVAEQTGWLAEIARKTGQMLADNAPDPVAAGFLRALHDFSVHHDTFWSIYLFGHGILNLGVVLALIAKKRWAHPASVVVLTGFVIYQLDRFRLTQAPIMIVLSVFDLVVIALVLREYRQIRTSRDTPTA